MFASSRNHNPSSFAQVLRQRQPRQRRPGSAGPCSKSIPEPSTISPSVAPVTAPLAESTPDHLLTTTAASTEHGSSEAELPTMEAFAAESKAENPPSPPNSPPVLNNHRSQLWTTRSLRLVHPAIPPKRRASHGAETSASGSASRTAHNPTKRAKTSEPGAEGARISTDVARPGRPSAFIYDLSGPKRYSCGLCSQVLNEQARQQCQRCPDVHFCLRCSINSAVLHPGHLFKMVEPLSTTTDVPQQGHDNHKTPSPSPYGGHNSTKTWRHQAQAQLSDKAIVKVDDKVDKECSGQNLGGAADEETRQMLRTVIRIPICKACRTRLFDLRYECQDCPDTNFCSNCRSLHSGHTLRVVTSPVIVSNSGESGADADDASIHNGVDDDGDIFVSPRSGSDSERQKREDSVVEQVGTESDNHGSGGVDERAGSGIENTPGSKKCHRIKSRSKSRKSPATHPDMSYQDLSRMAKTMAKAMKRMQTVVHAAEHIMRLSTVQNVSPRRIPGTHDRERSRLKKSTARRESSSSKALLDFPIDFATLDSDGDMDDDEEVEEENRDGDQDEGDDSGGGSGGSDSGSNGSGSSSDGSGGSRNPRRRKRSGLRHRQWSSRERRRLAQLKQKGWKDGQIGAELGRTASAVAQQWRKQKLSIR